MKTAAVILAVLAALSPSLAQVMIIETHAINATSDLCIELNRNRFDLAQCCKYPQINYRSFFQGNCVNECYGSRDICCSIGCIWRQSNIIDGDNQIDHQEVKEMLKKTVEYDAHWTDIIDGVVDECLDEVPTPEKPLTLCKFPWHITKVLGCTTRKLFLQCPKMKAAPECKTARDYVEQCM